MNKSRGRILPLLLVIGIAFIVGACTITDFSKFSKEPVLFQVKVANIAGGPYEGASIELSGDHKYGPVLSDNNGLATLSVLPGNYKVRVTYRDGFVIEQTLPIWGGREIATHVQAENIDIVLVINGKLNEEWNIRLHNYGDDNDRAVEASNIGYNNAGRGFTFDFIIPEGGAGIYRFEGEIAGEPAHVTNVEFFLDDESLGIFGIPTTGAWQSYSRYVIFPRVELTEGMHSMRLHFHDGGRNYKSFRLVPVAFGL